MPATVPDITPDTPMSEQTQEPAQALVQEPIQEPVQESVQESVPAQRMITAGSTTLKLRVEALLLAAGEPLKIEQLARLADDTGNTTTGSIREALETLQVEYAERSLELSQVASGWRLHIRQEYADCVARLTERRPPKYSRALLETVAIIAYRQPITRGEIEEIRGVAVSSNITRTLLERGWIRAIGHRDVPGRPTIYGTTNIFLDYFGLTSLEQLPTLAELQDLDEMNISLDLPAPNTEPEDTASLPAPRSSTDTNIETSTPNEKA